MPEVNPARLAGVAGQLTELADQLRTAVGATCAASEPDDGFLTSTVAAAAWAQLRPAVLGTGTGVAQFATDLAAAGTAWREVDTTTAQRFRSTRPGGR